MGAVPLIWETKGETVKSHSVIQIEYGGEDFSGDSVALTDLKTHRSHKKSSKTKERKIYCKSGHELPSQTRVQDNPTSSFGVVVFKIGFLFCFIPFWSCGWGLLTFYSFQPSRFS